MASTTYRPALSEGDVLVAPGTALPLEWQLETGTAGNGWLRLLDVFSQMRRQNQLNASGWTFFFMASPIVVTAFGFSKLKMFNAALLRLIAATKLQRCNCVQIDDLGMRSFLGIPYMRISAHPRHIQTGTVFSGRELKGERE